MSDLKLLLDLPFDILLSLAAGYLSYRLAFTGRDGHHSAVDVTFISLAFAALVKVFTLAVTWGLAEFARATMPVLTSVIAAFFALCIAALWRRYLQDCVFRFLRDRSISDHDGQSDVWRSMMARQLKAPTRVIVQLKDGTSLMCNQLAEFNDAPMGPCLFGADGSVALYVTDMHKKGDDDWKEVEPFDPDDLEFGYELSFISADQIARIDVTRPA